MLCTQNPQCLLIFQDVFEMRFAKIPDDNLVGTGMDSDADSEDERERKLLQLQEQLKQMQEQMRWEFCPIVPKAFLECQD